MKKFIKNFMTTSPQESTKHLEMFVSFIFETDNPKNTLNDLIKYLNLNGYRQILSLIFIIMCENNQLDIITKFYDNDIHIHEYPEFETYAIIKYKNVELVDFFVQKGFDIFLDVEKFKKSIAAVLLSNNNDVVIYLLNHYQHNKNVIIVILIAAITVSNHTIIDLILNDLDNFKMLIVDITDDVCRLFIKNPHLICRTIILKLESIGFDTEPHLNDFFYAALKKGLINTLKYLITLGADFNYVINNYQE